MTNAEEVLYKRQPSVLDKLIRIAQTVLLLLLSIPLPLRQQTILLPGMSIVDQFKLLNAASRR